MTAITKTTRDRPAAPEPVLRVTAAQWNLWLAEYHASARGVLLMITRAGGGPPQLSYPDALDVALTWGWIDSHKRAHDAGAWLQRFTPRRSTSRWSKINRAKAEALVRAGRMQPAGLREIEHAKQDGRWDAAYDSPRTSQVPADLARALARNKAATAFFAVLDATNRFAILYRVQTAKKPETRAARIAQFVAMLAKRKTLHPVRKLAGPRKPAVGPKRRASASGPARRRPRR